MANGRRRGPSPSKKLCAAEGIDIAKSRGINTMLRSVVMVMGTSGLVLFSKDFVNGVPQPRMIGSLVTTMLTFSELTAGMPVSYIELSGVGVTLASSPKTSVLCVLFHDREDGAAFGKLIATQLLHAFVEEYANDLGGKSGLNLKDFHSFSGKVPDVIRKSVQPVLKKLSTVRGISEAVLVTERQEVFQTAPAELDKLGVLAYLQALIGISTDIMAYQGDQFYSMSMQQGSSNSQLLLWRIDGASLVVVVNKGVTRSKYQGYIDESIDMLRRVCRLSNILQQGGR